MNLHAMLQRRAAEGRPVRVGLIGAGKFASMYLAQARHTPGIHVMGIADLAPDGVRQRLAGVGWPAEAYAARSLDEAHKGGGTCITDDAEALIRAGGLEVVIEATGDPHAGLRHARLAREHGRHMVMVNVEADVLAGPLLAREAAAAGLVYSLAYGDQPALICEMVDWARASGFEVVAAGKGTKYLPEYHASTPDTVWGYYGLSPERAAEAGMNSKMFNSFLDGTKSGIEMAAVANATGLTPPPDGLSFPPCGADELASLLRPAADGGQLHHKGQVEVISCLQRDGSDVERDLRWGVYVVFEAPSDYTARCFSEYGLVTDDSGRVSALYRPYHLIGLELGISVASVALRGEPTGAATGFRADVAATAKRDLAEGEVLDGEGGFTVWGKLMPAADSLSRGALPIGLAQGVKLTRPVAAGAMLTRADVALDESGEAVRIRREMEAAFAKETPKAAE
ncbi:MAG: SAF domain-containing protein [Kiloniellales bacterium]